jgi:hypothetical protein
MKKTITNLLFRMLTHDAKRNVGGKWYRPQIEALEERALLSTDTWTGGGPDNNWSTAANWDTGKVPAPGDDLVFPPFGGQSTPVAHNDLTPGTTFHSLSISPDFYFFGRITGNAIVLTGGISALRTGAQINLDGITLGADQTFSGGCNINSPVDLNGFTLTTVNSAPCNVIGGGVHQ